MLGGRVPVWSPEEWWSELEKGPSRKQSSASPVVLRGDLVGGREVPVLVEGSLTRERGMRGVVDGGVNVDGEG